MLAMLKAAHECQACVVVSVYSFASIRFVVAPTSVVPTMNSKSRFSVLHLCRNLQGLRLYQPIMSSSNVSENARLSQSLKDGASSIPFGSVWYDDKHLQAPGLHKLSDCPAKFRKPISS